MQAASCSVTQADVEVARASVGVDESIDVEIELRPKLNDENLPIVNAQVMVDGELLLEGFTVAPIADLLSEGRLLGDPGPPRGGPGPGRRRVSSGRCRPRSRTVPIRASSMNKVQR